MCTLSIIPINDFTELFVSLSNRKYPPRTDSDIWFQTLNILLREQLQAKYRCLISHLELSGKSFEFKKEMVTVLPAK